MEVARRILVLLENITQDVFDLNYLADKYEEGFGRLSSALEVSKERFENMMKK